MMEAYCSDQNRLKEALLDKTSWFACQIRTLHWGLGVLK